ncbi:ABC transporter ATP-binding protein [Camelliibacillus cellulosilyticus]|uniref:ABC transporter ATP-binding protein n=1 Tax=Camelliibacillus cellulosilyticus TaxID=2174486 RepID=A0ABV9GP54_9BACL
MSRESAVSTPSPSRKHSIIDMYKRLFFQVRGHWKVFVISFIAVLCILFLQFIIPQLTQVTIDRVIPAKAFHMLPWLALGIIGGAVLLGVFNYISSYTMAYIGQQAIFKLRSELYQHIQSMDMAFFDRNRTGDLMSRVTNDVNMLQQIVSSGMMQILTGIFTFIAIAIYMLYTDWPLTLTLLFTFPFMFIFTRIFGKRMRTAYKTVQKSIAEVSNHLQDTLTAIRLIKSFSSEAYEAKRFQTRNDKNKEANLKSSRFRSAFAPVIDFFNYLGLVVVLVFGAWQVMKGDLTVGGIAAFLAYLRLLQNPIRQFSRMINMVQQAAAAYERIMEVMETKPKVADKTGALPLPPLYGEIAFHHVDFSYQNQVPVFTDFNLKIAAGKMTALVGSSGAGKSTVVSLIARFYDPQKGSVTIDGYNLRDIAIASLRKQMGIVTQDIFLLNGTIRDNIAYGKPEATDEAIIAAAKAANAHDFIEAFPDGYHSQIGERGVRLSGGQKQRLSIARAILKDPRLIILDEATASLDTESEKLIQDALNRLLKGRTSLVIAHRLSTIQAADTIIVMEKGRIIEAGNHQKLLARSGRYRELYDLQFSEASTY